MLYFDIVTSQPYTTYSRVHGQREYPALLLQVALLDEAGTLLFKSFVQPDALDWETTTDDTYIPTRQFNRKQYPSVAQLVEQLKPLLTEWEVVVYNLREKWHFVNPFIGHIRQKWCSKEMIRRHLNEGPEFRFAQATSHIFTVGDYAADTKLRDVESIVRGSRDLGHYATKPAYCQQIEQQREYYLLKPTIDKLIERDTYPQWLAWQQTYQQLETSIFTAAGILMESYERQKNAKESANTICEHLTGYSLSLWERYGNWLEAPAVSYPIPSNLTRHDTVKRFRPM